MLDMKRRELFVSFLAPSNRHFLHQKCLGRSLPDTLDSSFVRDSLDHLVGEQHERIRDREPNRFGGLEIDKDGKASSSQVTVRSALHVERWLLILRR